jgi:actin, other eukaryote
MSIHALSPKDHRESITEMMFELFDLDEFYVEVPGVLSYHHTFKNEEDALVVDSGSGVTNIIPILNGIPERKNM